MRDAAVGFQCPTCVAEGAKQTRSGRTAYGGERSRNPALTSQVLIAINAAVWILILATGARASDWVGRLSLHAGTACRPAEGGGWYSATVTADQCNAVSGTPFDGVSDGAWWQLVTVMFTQVDALHIGFNMLALWVLGPQLELAIGRARFIALYLLSGLAASALVYWATEPSLPTVGASGAIFGLMGALLVIAFKVGGNVQQILMWIGLNAFITVIGSSFISWQGHLGGFLGGLAITIVLAYAPRARRTTWQAVGMALVAVALAVAIVARTATLT